MSIHKRFIYFGILWLAFVFSCLFLVYLERQVIKVQVLPPEYWTSKDAFHVLNDPSQGPVYYYAVRRIRELGDDNDPRDFVPLVHDHHSEEVRRRLVEFIAMSKFRELHKELLVSFHDESPIVVKTAIWANGYVRNREAAPKVLDHFIRGESYYSLPTLARIGNKGQIPILKSLLQSEKDEDIQRKLQLTILSIEEGEAKLEFPVPPTMK